MSVKWLHPNSDGHSWTAFTYIEESAPSMELGAPRHAKQTWFIVNLQPDGICMNCRRRPGQQDSVCGTYTCEDCQRECDAAVARLTTKRAA